jgi:hypothetical protein
VESAGNRARMQTVRVWCRARCTPVAHRVHPPNINIHVRTCVSTACTHASSCTAFSAARNSFLPLADVTTKDMCTSPLMCMTVEFAVRLTSPWRIWRQGCGKGRRSVVGDSWRQLAPSDGSRSSGEGLKLKVCVQCAGEASARPVDEPVGAVVFEPLQGALRFVLSEAIRLEALEECCRGHG